MSALDPHAKAARILAEQFASAAQEIRGDAGQIPQTVGFMMFALGDTYRKAAEAMEELIRSECTGTDGRKA